jgi:hypothetical protein
MYILFRWYKYKATIKILNTKINLFYSGKSKVYLYTHARSNNRKIINYIILITLLKTAKKKTKKINSKR